MAQVSFDTTAEESQVIAQIVGRALPRILDRPARPALAMDITAAHANGCPLDLVGLLAADDFNFAHDIGGIQRHIDRETGRLGGHFLPRFALPVSGGEVPDA